MKYALIISFLVVGGIILGAVLTYPAYQEQLDEQGNALTLEERGKGQFIYETKCATKCHQNLEYASLTNSSKYIIKDDTIVYPPANFTKQFWHDLLNNQQITNCKGVQDLDSRTIELLYLYLSNNAAESDANAQIAVTEFNDDLKKGLKIIETGKGAEVFANTCKNCHSDNLTRAFTDIEWRYQFENYIKIHEKQENAKLPEGKELEQLKTYIKSMSSASETDAVVVRNLLRKLRTHDQSTVDDGTENDKTELIPEELSWHDLDWEYPYDKGLEGLVEKYPGKPLIVELTNRYS